MLYSYCCLLLFFFCLSFSFRLVLISSLDFEALSSDNDTLINSLFISGWRKSPKDCVRQTARKTRPGSEGVPASVTISSLDTLSPVLPGRHSALQSSWYEPGFHRHSHLGSCVPRTFLLDLVNGCQSIEVVIHIKHRIVKRADFDRTFENCY